MLLDDLEGEKNQGLFQHGGDQTGACRPDLYLSTY